MGYQSLLKPTGILLWKPLWTECMELLGGKYSEIRDKLYADEL